LRDALYKSTEENESSREWVNQVTDSKEQAFMAFMAIPGAGTRQVELVE
jgi:hypothetical protein